MLDSVWEPGGRRDGTVVDGGLCLFGGLYGYL